MAGLRFPGTAFHHGWLEFGGATGGWSPATSADNDLMVNNEQGRAYIAPARYSQVRKVVFTITFQHVTNGSALGTTFRGRVGPSSTSTTSITLETGTIAPSDRPITAGPGQIWTNQGPNSQAAFYDLQGSENAISPRPVASPKVTTDAQCLIVEFDREDVLAAAFFADWDAATLLGDDEYIAYAPGIQRDDGLPFVGGLGSSNRFPTIIGFGVAVIQAPSPSNDSCTTINCTNGLFPDEQMATVFSALKIVPFHYRAADWDGIDSVHIFLRQTTRSAAVNQGNFTVRVGKITNNGTVITSVFEESFTPSVSGSITLAARTADIFPSLTDGDILVVDFKSDSGTSDQNVPWGWWEIIQKDCSRKSTFHPAGQGNSATALSIVPAAPSVIGDFAWAADQSVFDPAWYENYPDPFFIGERWHGGLEHFASNDSDELISLNADLAADIPLSAFNQVSDEVSSTPDADTGFRVRSVIITLTNPLLLAGRRVLKLRYNRDDWVSGTDEIPGGAGYQYVYTVPSSEFPELGPLFEIGAFNPEGCASTAAGLGDSPGVLVLTNGSTIPKKFNPVENVIQNNGIDTPFREEEPTATFVSVALSPAGGLTPGIYAYRYTLRNDCTGKESDPNPVDIVADVSAATPAAEITLNFGGVVIPSDSQVTQICIYRTLINRIPPFPVMAKVGCIEIPGTTIFVDSLSDSELDFLNDGLSTLNAPMLCLSVVEEFRNRLWALGDIPNLNPPGTVSVVNDSDIITGDQDTDLDRCVLGKFIQIEGDCTAYEILELLAPTDAGNSPSAGMRIKVDRDYIGTTDVELNFIICGHPNRLYISEPLNAECWPGINFLDVDPGDGDRLMGATSNFNRLLICKRRKTYVVTFREQPITEIVVPTLISRDIGCIAPRSFAQVASGSVWLSDRGLALYDGRGVAAVPESSVMNDLFVNVENPNYLRRDANGRAIGAAAVFYPKREQYLLLLPTVKTDRGASMILVWDTELRNITLLEFCQEFLSIEVAKDTDGNERVYLGDSNGFVWIWDVGDTDGIGFPNATGTVRGNITSVGIDPLTGASFLEDSAGSFPIGGVPGIGDLSGLSGLSGLTGRSNMGMAGACIFWRAANAGLDVPWQSRFVYASTSTKIFVTPNWGGDTPSVGDEYMLGPIDFRATFKPSNYGTDDFTKRDWRQVIVHEQESISTDLRTELLRDFQNSDIDEDTVTDAAGLTGEGRNYDLGFGQGRQIRPVGRLVHNFMGVRLTNFAPEEPLTLINHLLMVSPRQSK